MSTIYENTHHRTVPSLSLTSPGPAFEDPVFATDDSHTTELRPLPAFRDTFTLHSRASTSSVDLESAAGLNDSSSPISPVGGFPRMQRQTRSRAAAERVAAEENEKSEQNGKMTFPLEHRRRYSAADGTAGQTAQLMSARGFSLDNEPPTPGTPTPNTGVGFFELPQRDRNNFLLLVLLYFLQGIPMGLATGSVPFLLKEYLSYGQLGVFSLASYPYSLKLLWSPIVDAVWSPKIGRRKSWILPVQLVSGTGMLYLGSRVKEMMLQAREDGGASVWDFTIWWFMLVFTCATQDIAVDGKS